MVGRKHLAAFVLVLVSEPEALHLKASLIPLPLPLPLPPQPPSLSLGGTVEDELAALKRGQLAARSSASQPQQQSLGRPISEVLVGTRETVRQLEGIDAELEQLRKRARGQ